MQVIFHCNEYPPGPHGGIGSSVRDLTLELASSGLRVTVVGFYPDQEEPMLEEARDGVRVVRLRPQKVPLHWSLEILWQRFRLFRWLKREHRREPILFLEGVDYEGWLPLGFSGCPVVTRLHGSNLLFDKILGRKTAGLITWLESRQLRRSQYCIGVSDFAVQAIDELVPIDHTARTTIYNSVDTSYFTPAQQQADPAEMTVLFVNSINRRKGVEELLQAMPEVLKRFPQAVLQLAGRGKEDYIDYLMSLIDSRYHQNIRFLGYVPREDLPALLHQATVCCYPSHAETFGIAPVEAMAAGRPVIYSRTGPGPEVLEHEDSGLLADTHDPADIARQIIRLLEDPGLAGRLAKKGRERALAKFSRERWLKDNLTFYRDEMGLDLSLAGWRAEQ